MKLLFVTTSTKSMYHISGKILISSFLQHQMIGDLIYFTEDFQLIEPPNSRLKSLELSNYPFLIKWLTKFKKYIPIEFGGIYNYKLDSSSFKRYLTPTKTKDWNYKASLWFRKVASLHYTISKFDNYDYIVWIDNDCEIIQNMDHLFIEQLFNNKDFFYFLGKHRIKMDLGVEAGFMGFKKPYGFIVLQLLFDYYMSGKFINEIRWDDGWLLKQIMIQLQLNQKYNGNDLANHIRLKKNSHVMDNLPYNKYIIHKKGSHWKNHIDY